TTAPGGPAGQESSRSFFRWASSRRLGAIAQLRWRPRGVPFGLAWTGVALRLLTWGSDRALVGRLFQTMDELTEVDHIQPLAQQGANALANRQLLHGHCHDAKTAGDGSNQSRLLVVPTTRAKKQAAHRQTKPGTIVPRSTVEEPDEPKWLTSGLKAGG